MSATLPSAFELFNKSKDAVLKNQTAFAVILVVPMVFNYLGDILNSGGLIFSPWAIATESTNRGDVFNLIGFVLTLLFLPAAVALTLKAAKGAADTDPKQLISDNLKYFWRLIGAGLLIGLIVAVGLILLIVPGIILITRYFLTPYVLVAEDKSISEAMSRSAELSKGNAGAIWGVIGVSFLIGIVSSFPYIGWIISTLLLVVYSCAPAMRYLELSKK